MKKITTPLALVAALLSGIAAAPALSQDQPISQEDACANMGYLAAVIMEQRQAGATMSDLMARAEMSRDESVDLVDLTRAMIKDAFAQPQYGSPEHQQQAVTEFRNSVELTCYQRM